MADKVIVYISSMSANSELKSSQQRIINILSSKSIEYDTVDVAACTENKDKMRKGMCDPTGLPPQFFRGDTYLGNFKKFEEAVENEELYDFLKEPKEVKQVKE